MKYLITVLIMFLSFSLFAQTAGYIQKAKEDASAKQVSMKNPWIGAKLSMPLQDVDGNLGKNTLFSARIMYTLASGEDGSWAVPVVTTAGLGSTDILDPESGVNMGIYPYKVISDKERVDLVLHGGMGYKIVPDNENSFNQFSILGGIEAHLGDGIEKQKGAVGASLKYLSNSDDLVNSLALQIDGILPLGNNTGLFAAFTHYFKKELDSTLRVGLIANGVL